MCVNHSQGKALDKGEPELNCQVTKNDSWKFESRE